MNLLLTGCFNYSDTQIETLSSLGFNIFFMQYENEDIPLPAYEIDAIVCNGLFLNHDIDTFSRLKIIQLTSAGFDRVPIDLIKQKDIQLYNARGVYSVPMAEWVIFRVLEHNKKGWFFKREQELGHWNKHRGLREINGSNVAIVGAGSVGQEVAKCFQAFGAITTGFDIHIEETVGFNYMNLVEALKKLVGTFDVIVLTAPLLPSTRGLISREILLEMKEDAILINVARGGLIDERALCEVLAERKDLFAALDVFETEPLDEKSPLWKLENVAISPHNSFVSNGNNRRMFDLIYRNLKEFIEQQ